MSSKFFFFLGFILFFSWNCSRIFMPYELFSNEKNIKFSKTSQLLENNPYKIKSRDVLIISVFPNMGMELINPIRQISEKPISNNFEVLVQHDGNIFLPGLGYYFVKGKTIDILEDELVHLYSNIINEPYVKISLSNQHVVVFTGGKGSGKWIEIQEPQATLIEVLAMAGAIANGKAREVRIFRADGDNLNIFKLDLSKTENAHYAYISVHSGDIIYVKSQISEYKFIIENILPFTNFVTSIFLLVSLLK